MKTKRTKREVINVNVTVKTKRNVGDRPKPWVLSSSVEDQLILDQEYNRILLKIDMMF